MDGSGSCLCAAQLEDIKISMYPSQWILMIDHMLSSEKKLN